MLTVKPRVRNSENIPMEMLTAALNPESDLFLDLFGIEAIANNFDLFIKVYRAMNNWIRFKLENRYPTVDELKLMIEDAKKESQEGGEHNPLKCWNETNSQKDVCKMVSAIVNANID